MGSTASKKNKKSVKVSKPNFWVVLFFLQLIFLYVLTLWGYHNSKMPWEFDRFLHRTGLWRVYGYKEYGLNEMRQVYSERPNEVEVYEGFSGFVSERKKDLLVIKRMGEKDVKIEDFSAFEVCYIVGEADSFYEFEDSVCVENEVSAINSGDFVLIETEGRYLVKEDEYKVDLVKMAPISL